MNVRHKDSKTKKERKEKHSRLATPDSAAPSSSPHAPLPFKCIHEMEAAPAALPNHL